MFSVQKENITNLRSHQPWVEKYRPVNLSDVVGNEEIIKNLKHIAEEGNCPNMILSGSSGIGKCLGVNTPIILYDGKIKMVQEIQIGDKLMGDDSKPRNVLSLARGQETLYKVKQNKGDIYIVNESHILSLRLSCTEILRNGKNAEFKIINNKKYRKGEIIDICVKDYIKLSTSSKNLIKGYKVPITFPEKEIPFDPYLLGLWLGDGTSNISNLLISNQDSTIIYYLINKLKEYNCCLRYQSKYDYKILGNGSGKPGSNYILSSLQKLNLKNNKHIPDIYLYNSRKNQLSLLAGLIDSDGHYMIKQKCYEITQKNKVLSDGILFLCRSLGFGAYQKECRKSCMYKGEKREGTYYRITFSGEGIEKIPCLVPRKKAEPRKQIKNVLNTGIKLEKLEVGDYYGFEIDGNHRFILGDFTVTHNTSAVYCLANKLLGDNIKDSILELNASDDRGIDVVRTKIKNFSQKSINLKPGQHKIVILEEVDSMTSGAQQALRRLIELFSSTTRFFMTCNKSSKIIDPIQSRCLMLRLNKLTQDEMKTRLEFICKEENVPFTEEGLISLIFIGGGDARKVINYMESIYIGFGEINNDNVFKVCDVPRSDHIKHILDDCIKQNSKEALIKLNNLCKQGYAPIDIVTTIFHVVCNNKSLSEENLLEHIKCVGETHMRIIEGRGSVIQLYGLIVKLSKIN
jgi:DNA polymerase III delta prime subunit